MRVRRAHSAQMPMIGTDIDVAGTPTMSSLSTQEGTMTKTSIPAVSNASSAAADDVVTALFPAPRPEEPPRPTAQAKQKERCHKLKIAAHAKKAHKRAKREAFISVREMKEEEREKMRRSLDEIEAEAAAALENITVDFPTEEGAEEGAEDGVNFGEMDAV